MSFADRASHFVIDPPAPASFPDIFVDPTHASEGSSSAPYTIPKQKKGIGVGQRENRTKQGAPSAVDDAQPPPLGSEGEESAGEVVDYGGDASDSPSEEKQGKTPLQETAPTADDREIVLCEE